MILIYVENFKFIQIIANNIKATFVRDFAYNTTRRFIIIFSRQNTSDKILRVLFDELLMKETDLPRNYMDGLERVCKEDKYAFMTLDNMAAILQERVDCKLEPLDVITQTTIAMALRPNSPYRGIINAKCV